jgi:hypothetical protein
MMYHETKLMYIHYKSYTRITHNFREPNPLSMMSLTNNCSVNIYSKFRYFDICKMQSEKK